MQSGEKTGVLFPSFSNQALSLLNLFQRIRALELEHNTELYVEGVTLSERPLDIHDLGGLGHAHIRH